MRRQRKQVNKDKIVNITIAAIVILFICSLTGYFYYDNLKVKRHIAECVEICKPDKALEIFSKKGCYCQKLEKQKTIDPKDTI